MKETIPAGHFQEYLSVKTGAFQCVHQCEGPIVQLTSEHNARSRRAWSLTRQSQLSRRALIPDYHAGQNCCAHTHPVPARLISTCHPTKKGACKCFCFFFFFHHVFPPRCLMNENTSVNKSVSTYPSATLYISLHSIRFSKFVFNALCVFSPGAELLLHCYVTCSVFKC